MAAVSIWTYISDNLMNIVIKIISNGWIYNYLCNQCLSMPLLPIFQLYRWGNRRKPPTCRKSVTNLITFCCIEKITLRLLLTNTLWISHMLQNCFKHTRYNPPMTCYTCNRSLSTRTCVLYCEVYIKNY